MDARLQQMGFDRMTHINGSSYWQFQGEYCSNGKYPWNVGYGPSNILDKMAGIRWEAILSDDIEKIRADGFGGQPNVVTRKARITLEYSNEYSDDYVAIIHFDIKTGESAIKFRRRAIGMFALFAVLPYEEFVAGQPRTAAGLRKLVELQARVEELQAKVAAQAREIFELELAPGGPEYLEAKKRFEAGDYAP